MSDAPKESKKSLLDRMIDCKEAEIRKQPCPDSDKKKSTTTD